MREIVLCLVIVSLYSVGSSSTSLRCECGWRNSVIRAQERIVSGHETGRNEYPWMAWLSNECGGSIITQYHVLTAAHCTNGTNADLIEVIVGKHYLSGLNSKESKHPVSEIIQHEGYKGRENWYINDISLLLFYDPITFTRFVGPVCLPSAGFDLIGKLIKVTGWGITKGTNALQNALQEVDLEVISNKECKKRWPTLNDQQTQICVYTRGKDTCNGDSGGPLVYLDPESNRYTQVALVSYGPSKCGSSTKPSVNTDLFSYIEWIKNATTQSQPSAKICTKVEEDKQNRKR